MTAPVEQFFNAEEVAAIARSRGLKHITRNSVVTAAYYGDRPLKRTKVNGRVYYARSDIERWLAGEKLGD